MAPHFKNDSSIYHELMHLSELIPTIYSLLLSKLSQCLEDIMQTGKIADVYSAGSIRVSVSWLKRKAEFICFSFSPSLLYLSVLIQLSIRRERGYFINP